MYEYEGASDATRESPEALGTEECNRRLTKLFMMDGYRMAPVSRAQWPFCLSNPPPQVHHVFDEISIA